MRMRANLLQDYIETLDLSQVQIDVVYYIGWLTIRFSKETLCLTGLTDLAGYRAEHG
jgi:hypothetical protein